jgi:hypothetical protein
MPDAADSQEPIGAEQRACPYCKEDVRADALKCKHCGSLIGSSGPTHKGTCPYCKESIHAEAIKCKHCGSDLSEGSAGDTGRFDGGPLATVVDVAWPSETTTPVLAALGSGGGSFGGGSAGALRRYCFFMDVTRCRNVVGGNPPSIGRVCVTTRELVCVTLPDRGPA